MIIDHYYKMNCDACKNTRSYMKDLSKAMAIRHSMRRVQLL